MIGEVVLTTAEGAPAAWHVPGFLGSGAADAVEQDLLAVAACFKNGFMLVGELWTKTPRLVAEFGDGEFVYPDTLKNDAWPPVVQELRDRVADTLSCTYNYAIANWYRDGADFTGWHADKMQYHVTGSTISMVSVGAPRRFEFRSEATRAVAASVELEHGSLLVMAGPSQDGFEHSLRPDPAVRGRRVSLTFRHVLPTEPRSAPAPPRIRTLRAPVPSRPGSSRARRRQ